MVYTLFFKKFGMWSRYDVFSRLEHAEAKAAYIVCFTGCHATSVIPHKAGTIAPYPKH